MKREGKELEQELKNGIVDYESYLEKRNNYAEKMSDIGKSNLAEYVMHRKTILDILAQNIRYKDQEQQKYAYEKNIHQLIFPMTKTSDDIDYLQHNLWIIDEKLAYHHYLASDMKIKKMEEVENNSGKEPDLIIFDSPFAFTDEEEQPYRNITIIEFKRPGREHYNDAENPIRQIKEYMDDIVEGKVKTKDGEFLNGTENIRFFCYIICDVDLSIKKLAKLEDLKVTPDNMGFYKYIDSYKAYLEIIPYNKLIQDSKKRNRILFDKLFNYVNLGRLFRRNHMDHFELVSEYKPTGDQPQAIKELVEGFKEGNQCQTLLGVTGSGKTFTMANVIQQLNKPTLIIAHNKTLAAQLYGEFKEFFPNNAVEYFVS